MRKKILMIAGLLICFAISAAGTYAYFTAEETSHNVITTGSVNIEIEEWQETNEGLKPYPKDTVKIMPGMSVSKIVKIRNLDARSYIRAKYEVVIKDSQDKNMELSPETKESLIEITMGSSKWVRVDGDDEWWYYTDIVEKGNKTEELFKKVTFDGPNMTNEYQNCTVEVIVTAQAVQSANNGGDVEDIVGWPTI